MDRKGGRGKGGERRNMASILCHSVFLPKEEERLRHPPVRLPASAFFWAARKKEKGALAAKGEAADGRESPSLLGARGRKGKGGKKKGFRGPEFRNFNSKCRSHRQGKRKKRKKLGLRPVPSPEGREGKRKKGRAPPLYFNINLSAGRW